MAYYSVKGFCLQKNDGNYLNGNFLHFIKQSTELKYPWETVFGVVFFIIADLCQIVGQIYLRAGVSSKVTMRSSFGYYR